MQLPLPAQVDAKRILLAVAPEKDVDGFHPCNVGSLVAGLPGPRACTPAGIIELLKRYRIPIAGRRAVVVGRSDIVGKPVALLLLHEHATVTICHSKTPDLPAVCREADILVAAMGRPAMITGGLHQARRDGDRRGHQPHREPRRSGAHFPAIRAGEAGGVRQARAACWWAMSTRWTWRNGRRVHAGAGRRGAADHRHADGQHRGSGRAPGRLMLKVGLTGGLACGKTFVGEALAGCGCLLIQADELGHAGAGAGRRSVRRRGAGIRAGDSGRGAATSTGTRWRRGCSARPSAWRGSTAWCIRRWCGGKSELMAEFAAREPHGIAVVEAAILIETGSYQRFDRIILVTCREEQQVERAMRREGAGRETSRARLSRQMPLEEKRKFADFVIDTSGEKEDTLRQTRAVYEALRRIES